MNWNPADKRNGTCTYCGTPIYGKERTRDHVLPRSRGGEQQIVKPRRSLSGNTFYGSNVVPCCRSCNAEKGQLLLSEWIAQIIAELDRTNLPRHRRLLLEERRSRINAMATEFAVAFWAPDR
jgi:hypothetical protein